MSATSTVPDRTVPEHPVPAHAESIAAVELLKLRSQLAWNWFEFHSRQRISMFNYFLLITGILVNGYAAAVRDRLTGMSIGICAFGFVQALCFLMIDVRSRNMIHYGESVLEKLERDVLFPDGFRGPGAEGERQLGLRRCDEDLREGSRFTFHRLIKMKYWIRVMYVLAAAGFVLAALASRIPSLVGG